MIKNCPVCGNPLDSVDGFRQTCVCGTPLIRRPALFKNDWMWMIDADKIHMQSPTLWGADYLPIQRMGANKRTVKGFLYFIGSKYVVRTIPGIMQSSMQSVKTADLTFDNIEAVLHEGWIPQSRIYDDRS